MSYYSKIPQSKLIKYKPTNQIIILVEEDIKKMLADIQNKNVLMLDVVEMKTPNTKCFGLVEVFK